MSESGILQRPREINFLIGIGLLAAVAIALYWTAWFTAPSLVQARSPAAPDYQIYIAFEQAFPLADSWLAIASLMGALGLWKMRDWGLLFMLLAGGSAIFLGLMDLLYGLQHHTFIPFTQESVISLAIVGLLFAFGPLAICLAWRQRRLLIRPSSKTS